MTVLGVTVGATDEEKAAKRAAKAEIKAKKRAEAATKRSGDQVIGTALQTLGPVALLAPLVVAGLGYIEAHSTIRFGADYSVQLLVYLGGVLPIAIAKVHMHFIRVASAAENLLIARINALEAQVQAQKGDPFVQVQPVQGGGTA